MSVPITPTINVFISHAATDDAVVTRLYAAFTDAGISAWVDHERGITYNDNWERAIQNAVNACKVGLFVLSPASAHSDYCLAEWNRVLALGKKLYIAMITPVPTAEIPLRLGVIQYVDLTHDFDGALRLLIEVIQAKPRPRPFSYSQHHTILSPIDAMIALM